MANGIYYNSTAGTLSFFVNNQPSIQISSGGTTTISGNTVFEGTISATTIISSSFDNGTFTGLTVNGNLSVTGDTSISGTTTFVSPPVFNDLTNSSEINSLVVDSSGNLTVNSNLINTVNTSTGLSGNTVSGVVTLTNTLPDQTVTITGGTNMQIVGTYPSFGVNFTGTTGGVTQIVAGTNVTISPVGGTGVVTINSTGGGGGGASLGLVYTTGNNLNFI